MTAQQATTKPNTKKIVKHPAARKLSAARSRVIRTQAIDDRKELVVAIPPLKAPKFLQGFLDFVRTQGVVGLAVGLVLGIAAKGVVDSLVANIFNPIIGLIGNGGDLSGRFVCLRNAGEVCTNKLGYGDVISQIISFMIVAGVVYFVVRGLRLDKLDKKKPV